MLSFKVNVVAVVNVGQLLIGVCALHHTIHKCSPDMTAVGSFQSIHITKAAHLVDVRILVPGSDRVHTALPRLVVLPANTLVPSSDVGGHFKIRCFQIFSTLLRVLGTDLGYACHHCTTGSHINLVSVPALVIHDLDTAVRKLFDGAFDGLIVRDGPARDLHLRIVQRPLIGFCRLQHRPPIVHQKSHGAGQVSNLPLCLCHDGGNLGDTHKHFRCRHPRKVYDLSVVPLVTLYYVVQQLFKVPLADVGGALDGLFDFLQADAVGAKRPDILHRDFVQLSSQFQTGAYLVKDRRFQTAV